MTRLRYLQQVTDSNLNAGLHVEPGLWLNIPATTDPALLATISRLATIPHGTSIVAQGIANPPTAGPPAIPLASITPFSIGNPAALLQFPEQTLADQTNFRTSGQGLTGVTQEMVSNPNSVLTNALTGLTIASTVMLQAFSDDTTPILGGGVANTAFLQWGSDGPNAVAARVRLHVLAPDHSRIGTAEPAAVQPDRPAQLQRRQLAARQRHHAPPGTHAVTSDGLLAVPKKPESGAVAMMQSRWRCAAHSHPSSSGTDNPASRPSLDQGARKCSIVAKSRCIPEDGLS